MQFRILSLRPSLSTTYANKASSDTKKTQLSGDKNAPKAGRKGRMPTFPVKLSKGSQVVTIYAPSVAKPSYRVVFRVQQKRHSKYFKTYEEARKRANLILTQIASGNNLGAGFTTAESQQFDLLRKSAKLRGVSPEKAIADWIAAVDLLPDPEMLVEAARSFSKNQISRVEISTKTAITDYLIYKEPILRERTLAQEKLRLRKFAAAFHGNIGQLTRAGIRSWINSLKDPKTKQKISPKTRNHYRGSLKTFLEWCVSHDYLEPDSVIFPILQAERTIDHSEIAIYSPEEFQRLLDNAEGVLRTCVALSGLTGVRAAELQKLEWTDFGEDHLEVGKDKSKTRSRRLIDITPTLRRFLPKVIPPDGLIWPCSPTQFGKEMRNLFTRAGVRKKNNAFRHSFISYRLAMTSDENLTSREAGNSPEMIYKNYREVVTLKAAQKWFSVI